MLAEYGKRRAFTRDRQVHQSIVVADIGIRQVEQACGIVKAQVFVDGQARLKHSLFYAIREVAFTRTNQEKYLRPVLLDEAIANGGVSFNGPNLVGTLRYRGNGKQGLRERIAELFTSDSFKTRLMH